MNSLKAFIKKEIVEQIRTYKVLILFSVMFLFGMTSPLLAKLMPQLISGVEMNHIIIQIPDPVVSDAYAQFFKNMTGMGIVAVLLVFGGTLSGELTKGTLIHILAKGLPRPTVIYAKFFSAVLLWTVCYLAAAAANYGYSAYLFQDHAVKNLHLSLFCLWLFVCFVIALILFSGTVVKGSFGGLILSSGTLLLLMLLNTVPSLQKYNPVTLASVNTALITGEAGGSEVMKAIWVTLVLMAAALFAAVRLFEKKRI